MQSGPWAVGKPRLNAASQRSRMASEKMAKSKLKKKLKSKKRATRAPAHGKGKAKKSALPPWWAFILIGLAAVVLFYIVFWKRILKRFASSPVTRRNRTTCGPIKGELSILKKVLILGGTGMLGHALFVQLSLQDSLNVYATVRNPKGLSRWFSQDLSKKIVRYVCGV